MQILFEDECGHVKHQEQKNYICPFYIALSKVKHRIQLEEVCWYNFLRPCYCVSCRTSIKCVDSGHQHNTYRTESVLSLKKLRWKR